MSESEATAKAEKQVKNEENKSGGIWTRTLRAKRFWAIYDALKATVSTA